MTDMYMYTCVYISGIDPPFLPLMHSAKILANFASAYLSLYRIFVNQTLRLLFFSLLVFVRLLFEGGGYCFGKPTYQRWIDKVSMNETVIIAKRSQWYTQPHSCAVCH